MDGRANRASECASNFNSVNGVMDASKTKSRAPSRLSFSITSILDRRDEDEEDKDVDDSLAEEDKDGEVDGDIDVEDGDDAAEDDDDDEGTEVLKASQPEHNLDAVDATQDGRSVIKVRKMQRLINSSLLHFESYLGPRPETHNVAGSGSVPRRRCGCRGRRERLHSVVVQAAAYAARIPPAAGNARGSETRR